MPDRDNIGRLEHKVDLVILSTKAELLVEKEVLRLVVRDEVFGELDSQAPPLLTVVAGETFHLFNLNTGSDKAERKTVVVPDCIAEKVYKVVLVPRCPQIVAVKMVTRIFPDVE